MESLLTSLRNKEAKKAAKKSRAETAAESDAPMEMPSLPATPVQPEMSSLPATPVQRKKTKKERDPDAPKKEPNSWIVFTIRVNDILKKNEVPLPGAEQKQFCGALKTMHENYKEMTEEAILDARKIWVKPEASKQFLAGKNKKSDSSSETSAKKRGRPKKTDAVIEEIPQSE